MKRSWRAAILGAAVVGATASAGIGGAAGAEGVGTPTGAGEPTCRLVELATPPGTPWGTVTSIAAVDGKAVYLGSFDNPEADGRLHQRAAVWHGLDAQPVLVGPDGFDSSVAFDVTSTGLVNGSSHDWTTGTETYWVQDLATGEVRVFDQAVGPGVDETVGRGAYIRRVNDAGATVGTVDRGRGKARAHRAVAYDPGSTEPWTLQSWGRAAEGWGINNHEDRVGFIVHHHLRGDGRWWVVDPTVWDADGNARPLAKIGLDAFPRVINDARQVAGFGWVGAADSGHVEALFWPSRDEVVRLGVLDGGGWSDAFGMDESGRVVGAMDVFAPDHPATDPFRGTLMYNFAWTQDVGPGQVLILPSLYAQDHGRTDWRDWLGLHAAHATDAELDQIGAGTHTGYADDGTPLAAPTVFLHASTCGQLVATTQDPWHLQSLPATEEAAVDAVTMSEQRGMRRP